MDENRYYYKQNTYTSNASDDSSCSFSLPWLTDTRKRRSRLGNHGRNIRVLQDINNRDSNVEQLNENDESSHKPSDKTSALLDYTKPTDTDTDSHDVGFMKSNDALDTSFTKLTTHSVDLSFLNADSADMMDISVSKADTNYDMELLETDQYSSPDQMNFNDEQRNVYSSELILKNSNHSSFENDVLNLNRNSHSSELLLKRNSQPPTKSNDVFNALRSALPIDMVLKTSDYSSMLDEVSIERNPSPLAIDLVLNNNGYTSPKEIKTAAHRRTPLPAGLVLKTNDYDSPKENIPPAPVDAAESSSKNNNYSSPIMVDSHRTPLPDSLVMKKNDYSSPKDSLLLPVNFVPKKNDFFSPPEQIPVDLATKMEDHMSPKEHFQVNCNSPLFPVNFVPIKNDFLSPHGQIAVDLVAKKNDHLSPREHIQVNSDSPLFPVNFVPKKNDSSSPKENVALDPARPLCAVDLVVKPNQPSPKNKVTLEPPSRTPFSSEPLQKANQSSPKKREISNSVPELFAKSGQLAAARPAENCAGEFKQPEAIRPAKKDDFQFEAPLPPSSFKVNEKLPPFISIKGKSYSVTNILGSGGSSMVYQVLHPDHGEILAIKQVKLSEVDESIAEGYIDEVKLLKKLQKCESIIKMYDHEIICENGKKLLNVVMERGDTDLAELLKNVNKYKKPSIYMILYYWTEMLSAVYEIHNEGIIHSDLKPANFLIVNGRLKLIDFGIASSMQGDMTSVYKDVFTGTLNYMSPEAVQFVNCASGSIGYRITYKTDVWSLGCILYHLIYGRLPFQHLKKKWDKMRAIVDPKIEIEFPDAKGVPSVLMSALKSCLDKDPKKRMSVGQLLQLPYCGN